MLPCELFQLVLLSSDLLPVATSSKREHPKIMHNDCLNYKRFKMFTGNCIEQSNWSSQSMNIPFPQRISAPSVWVFLCGLDWHYTWLLLSTKSFLKNIIIWSILYSFDISQSIKLYIYNNFITQHFNWNHLLLLQLQKKNELLRFQHLYLKCHIYTCMQDMWFDQFNLFYCYTR